MIDLEVNFLLLNILLPLLMTGIGAYLGYRFGIIQEKNIRRDEEKDVKNLLFKSLIKELTYHKSIYESNIINIEKSPYKDDDETVIIPLPPYYKDELIHSSFDSVVYSGKFSLISPDLQIKISNYYKDVKELNKYIGRFEKIIERDVNITISQRMKNIQ